MKRIALVTGASSGIGRAITKKLAHNGFSLILLARREDKLIELSDELLIKFNTQSLHLQCDVRDFNQVSKALESLSDEWQNIELLVNNAGLAAGFDKIQDGSLEDWNTMIDTNIKGLLNVSKVVIPLLQSHGKAQIVNIGSIAGREVYPYGNVYCGTKAAVSAISQGMVIDLLGTGVKVCNIEPGMVETEFALVRFNWNEEKASNVYKGLTPLSAEDIAEVLWNVVSMPYHINIQNILVTSIDQATATIVNRK